VTDNIPNYPDIAGKVAVVTGGSGGIGAATCRLLAANGVKVAVNGRDENHIEATVEAIRADGGEAVAAPAECTDPTAIEAMRRRTEELGPVGVVAAFVGGSTARPGLGAGITDDDWQSTVDGSLTATFFTLKSFLPGMVERGRGSVVTMASSAARVPTGAPAPYAVAKAGVVMLTPQLAKEVAPRGVRANCLAPHTVLVERTRRVIPEELRLQIAAEIRLAGWAIPKTSRSPPSFSPPRVPRG
jgi:3-oxoacyl-[acyl-carrier protein] reductase